MHSSTHPIPAHYSFIDLEKMKGCIGLVGWRVADGLPTTVVTHQLQVERGRGKVRRQETDVRSIPTYCATQPTDNIDLLIWFITIAGNHILRRSTIFTRNSCCCRAEESYNKQVRHATSTAIRENKRTRWSPLA